MYQYTSAVCECDISVRNWIEYGINYPIHIIPYDSIKSPIAHLNLQVTRTDTIYWLTGVGRLAMMQIPGHQIRRQRYGDCSDASLPSEERRGVQGEH